MSIALSPEVERQIAEKVESGQYGSASDVVSASLEALDAKEWHQAKISDDESVQTKGASEGLLSLLEKLREISRQVPDEEWTKLPTDLSMETDHYLYGSPKQYSK